MVSGSGSTLPARTPGVISREVGDEFVVIHPQTQTAHALSGAVAQTWRSLEQGQALDLADAATQQALAQLAELDLVAFDDNVRGISRRALLTRGGLLVAGAGVATIALPMASAAASGTPSVTLSPTSGSVGTLVTVTIAGFTNNATLTVTFNGATSTVYQSGTTPKTTDSTGAATFTYQIPSAAKGKFYDLIVTSTKSTYSATKSAPFHVTG